MLRRGAAYSLVQNPDVTSGALSEWIIRLNEYITLGAFGMLLIQVVFVVNFFHSIRNGEKVENDNLVNHIGLANTHTSAAWELYKGTRGSRRALCL